ncbi:MAG: Mov34/MPN/PAD-1 family protein [Promethearchaeota archaeon]
MTIPEDSVFPVYMSEKILDVIKTICKKYDIEVFGYLVGEIFTWSKDLYVIIEEQVFVKEGTESTPYTVAQIQGSAGKYEEEFQKLKQMKNNENLRIVGWWHSHPNFGCFLSSTDVKTQKFFFPESYQIALVIDPIKDCFKFFSLDKNSINGYKPISFAIISTD